MELGEVGNDVELRHLATLYCDGADAVDAIEWRLERVGGDFPELRLGERGGGEAVAEDGKGGEGEPVGGEAGGAGQGLLRAAECGVDELQGAKHIGVPVEEEADLCGAAAGGGAHGGEAGNAVDGVFNGLGDGDLHLLDGHDAVVDADDDAGEVCFRKDGDGGLVEGVDAGDGEGRGEEEDRAEGGGEPVGLGGGVGGG